MSSLIRFLFSCAASAALVAHPLIASAQDIPPPDPAPPPEVAPTPTAPPPEPRNARTDDDDHADDDSASFYTGANGPGVGKSQGLVGMGGVIIQGGVGGPAISLGVVYGIADMVDFQFRNDLGVIFAGSAGVVGVVDPSFLLRLTGKRSMEGNFGLKFGPEIVYLAGGGGGVAAFGVAPGMVASFGSSKVQGSINLEFPIYFAVAGSVSGTGTISSVRPGVAIEGNVGGSTNLFFKVGPQILFEGGYIVTMSTGVTF